GGIYAHYLTQLYPKTFNFLYSIEILVIVVLGGMVSLKGTIIAAIILGLATEYLRRYAEYRMLIYSALLIGIILFKTKGFTLKSFIQMILDLGKKNPLSSRTKGSE
ncbi:MAG TPA: branched-chain amino acid ABC transporter permease, partial [Epulopiscium sp.]|nr:branched-chain amino acid ABC transporter permease [Candidatus Epulonipiscium sp.]